MALTISEKELASLEGRQRAVLVVRDQRTKKGYAVMSEKDYASARPLIEFVSHCASDASDSNEVSWTEELNARRVALVNKKHDSKLSHAEERELAALQAEVCRHQERVAPLNNRALELILEALEQRAKSSREGRS